MTVQPSQEKVSPCADADVIASGQAAPLAAPLPDLRAAADVPQAWACSPADIDAGNTDGAPVAPVVSAPKDKLSMSRKIIFSAPTVATLPFVAMWGMHGNKSYQSFGASIAMIALFTALARSLDVVSDPAMSYWTDSSSCDKLPTWLRGRRKPFMFFGCFAYSTLLFLLLNPPYASQTALSLWFGFIYTAYFLSNTLTTIPYDALGPELSEDSDERTGLFFVANLFDGVGTLVALGLPMIMTGMVESGARKGFHGRNDFICKNDLATSMDCLKGRTCGDFLTTGEDGAFKGNATLATILNSITSWDNKVLEDARQGCVSWLRTHQPQHMLLGIGNSTAYQNDEFCFCVGTCGDACSVANKRTGFMLVGIIFGIWFIITMVTAVCLVPEKRPSGTRPKSPPIVPSMRSALNNRLFCILLPAWLCDALVTAICQSLLPYFIEAVVAPAYQTQKDHGRDCSASPRDYEGGKWVGKAGMGDSPMWQCDTVMVTTCAGFLALVTAIAVLPLWSLLVSKIGKVRTWFLWSLTMAVSNVLFLFVTKGGLVYLFLVAAINGAPLGAKFLADAILADIIDYDEFLTGMRSEATYFMFKSFLPKIVQIPASAIPIALLKAFGYRDPIGGRVQDQPDSVGNYIKFIVGMGFVFSVGAYFLKTRYPLRNDRVIKLAEALKEHKEGNWAKDPVSGREYMPMKISQDEEQEAFWLFNHFDTKSLQHAFSRSPEELTPAEAEAARDAAAAQASLEAAEQAARQSAEVSIAEAVRAADAAKEENDTPEQSFGRGCQYLVLLTKWQLGGSLCFLFFSLIGTGSAMPLIDDETWQFVPTLFVVCVGIGISSCAFASLRFKAARQLTVMAAQVQEGSDGAFYQKKIKRLLDHQALLAHIGRIEQELIRQKSIMSCQQSSPVSVAKEDPPTTVAAVPLVSATQIGSGPKMAAPAAPSSQASTAPVPPSPAEPSKEAVSEPSMEARPEPPVRTSAEPASTAGETVAPNSS